MSYTGGDIVQLRCDHPTLGAIVLQAKAAEDNNLDLGGVRGVDDKSMVTGGGESIRSLQNGRWEAKITVMWDMSLREELQKLVKLSGNPVEGVWTIVHINGSVYKGTGAPVGDLSANVNNVTVPLTLQGSGQLERLA